MLKMGMVLLSGCALAGLASGCVVDVDAEGRAVTGDIDVRWTVDNTVDPAACDYYAPSIAGIDFEFALYDGRGRPVTTEYARCEDFALSLTVQASDYGPGYYRAEVTMVDARDRAAAVSTTQTLERILVVPRTAVVLDVDFPPSSFLTTLP